MEGNGWSEFSSIGSQMHQATAPQTGFMQDGVFIFTRLNAKFTNKDGREVVFNCRRELITDYPDKGTYNYDPGENVFVQISGIAPVIGQHNRWDMEPYTELMNCLKENNEAFRERMEALARKNGGAKWNPGIYGNSFYWLSDAGNGRGRQ